MEDGSRADTEVNDVVSKSAGVSPAMGDRPPETRANTFRSFWHRRRVIGIARWCGLLLVGFYGLCVIGLLYVRWFTPLTTSVQLQRRAESFFDSASYTKRYSFVALSDISPHLVHAAVASEDARFFEHHGIDWVEFQVVVRDVWKEGELQRGGSTITQQLVKNLFLTTHRFVLRKGLEFLMAPLAELFLSRNASWNSI